MAGFDADRLAEITAMLRERVIKGEQVTMLPEALATARKRAGMSQKQLAAAAGGMSEGLVALIETGARQPSPEKADALAFALGVPLRALAIVNVPVEQLRRMLGEVAA